ncbi:hypothetical protein BSKO_03394 [Bryopsis sp. KO-2023]|nr:hypothetical protein BSKO_03394 [Bryopsis sp. KO-2023]
MAPGGTCAAGHGLPWSPLVPGPSAFQPVHTLGVVPPISRRDPRPVDRRGPPAVLRLLSSGPRDGSRDLRLAGLAKRLRAPVAVAAGPGPLRGPPVGWPRSGPPIDPRPPPTGSCVRRLGCSRLPPDTRPGNRGRSSAPP